MGGGTAMLCFTTYTRLHIPSQKVRRCECSNMGSMHSSQPFTRDYTLVPWGWDSYRPLLGTCAWPGIGLVWNQRIDTRFTTNISILANTRRCNPYKSCINCSGRSTKTCGTGGHTSIIQKRARQRSHMQIFCQSWEKSSDLTKRRKLIRPADPTLACPKLSYN